MQTLTLESIDAQIAQLQAQRAQVLSTQIADATGDITIDIVSKTRRRFGQTYPGQSNGLKATVGKRNGVKFIRLFGNYVGWQGSQGKPVDRTFKVGDTVEMDSYNLRYLGEIVNITEKRISIKGRYGAGLKSMDLFSFSWRNYNFDLEEALAENAETSMYI